MQKTDCPLSDSNLVIASRSGVSPTSCGLFVGQTETYRTFSGSCFIAASNHNMWGPVTLKIGSPCPTSSGELQSIANALSRPSAPRDTSDLVVGQTFLARVDRWRHFLEPQSPQATDGFASMRKTFSFCCLQRPHSAFTWLFILRTPSVAAYSSMNWQSFLLGGNGSQAGNFDLFTNQ